MDRGTGENGTREPGAAGARDVAWMAGLLALALALRLAHLWTVRHSPFFEHLVLDPRMYDEWARRIAAGDWLGQRPFFQDPLYAYVLAVLYRVLGPQHLPAAALQLLAGACVAPLLYDAARPWFGRAVAVVAGLLAATYLPSIYYEGLILKTWLALWLVALALWAWSRALRSAGGIVWAGVGAVVGLAALTRGNLLLVLPVLALAHALGGRDPSSRGAAAPTGRRYRQAVLLLLGAALVVTPVTLRNRLVGGEWILTTSNAGQNFYIGNNPWNDSGQYARLPFVDANPRHEERGFAREAQARSGRRLTPAQVSRFWFAEAWRWIAAHPGAAARLMWRKTRNYWGAYEIPDNLDYQLYREHAPVLRLPLPGFGSVAPLGLLGALLAWRRPGWPRALLVLVVVYSVSVVLFFVFSRFRMPMMPALFVLAGHALVEIGERLRHALQRQPAGLRRLAAPLALGLVAFAFVNLPVRARADRWSYRLAAGVGLPVRAETSATAHFNLGVAYAAQAAEEEDAEATAWLERAEVQLRRAVDLDDRYAAPHVELGKVLARLGRTREAIPWYRQAAVLEPRDFRNPHALGLLYQRLGDHAEAARWFAIALTLEPRHLPSALRLGQTLLAAGRPDEAAQAFRHVLQQVPDHPAASSGLRQALQAAGRLSEP